MSDVNGALPEGWAEVALGELVQPKVGLKRGPWGGALKKKIFVPGGVKVYEQGNVIARDFGRGDYYITPEYFESELAGFEIASGDVLITCAGTIGKTAVVTEAIERGIINQALLRVRLEPSLIDTTFFQFFIRNIAESESFEKLKQGTALKNLASVKELKAFDFHLPPLAEQRRIVSKIESLQERSSRARESLSEVGPLLEQMRQSVLRAAFSGRLTADWRAANPDVEPASELLSRIRNERRHRWEQSELAKYKAKGKQPPKNWQDKYKEPKSLSDYELKDLPTLPDSWCWVSLMEVHSAIEPFCYGVVQPGPEVDDGAYLVRVCDLEEGRILTNQLRKIGHDIHEKYGRCHLNGGEVLVSVVGTIGRVAVTDETVAGANLARAIARITPVSELRPEWIAESITSPRANDWLNRASREVARKTLNLNVLERLAVPLAPQAEMEQIIELLRDSKESVQQMESVSAESESALTQLDQSILAKAFHGELVPQDPRDEPASELLARIRTTRQQAEAEKAAAKKNTRPARKKK